MQRRLKRDHLKYFPDTPRHITCSSLEETVHSHVELFPSQRRRSKTTQRLMGRCFQGPRKSMVGSRPIMGKEQPHLVEKRPLSHRWFLPSQGR